MADTTTPFASIYDKFLSKITDDMYMELTQLDTYKLLKPLLISAIQWFEFPRVDTQDYTLYEDTESESEDATVVSNGGGVFNCELSEEEQNILATYMVVEWIGQQLASIELTRMKYSGSDFKFTSQANHLSKLESLKENYEREGYHLQRLYKRRTKRKSGNGYRSTFDTIMAPINEEE